MLNVGKKSRLNSETVISMATDFFGPSGLGLEVKEQSDCCVRFEGIGGFVYVDVAKENNQSTIDVTIQGREFDYQIRQFLNKI